MHGGKRLSAVQELVLEGLRKTKKHISMTPVGHYLSTEFDGALAVKQYA